MAIEAAFGIAALAAPWLSGFARDCRARNPLLAMGLIEIVVTLLSRPEETPARG